MLFDNFICNVKIITVLKLSWGYSNADVSPRNFHAFSFRINGNAHYTFEDAEFSVNRGDLLFVPENVSYHITAQNEDLYVIHFELPEKVQTYLELFHMEDYAKTKKLFKDCYEIWREKENGYYYKALSIFYNILSQMSATHLNTYTDDLHQKLKPAVDYLHANYTNSDICVQTLCNVAHMSDTWFRKLFMKCYGTKPITYINTLRINYAKELLESGYYKVENVANMVGFDDAKYFSTLFKHYTGFSPLQYKIEKQDKDTRNFQI